MKINNKTEIGLKDKNGNEICNGDTILVDGFRYKVIYSFCQFKLGDCFATYPILDIVCPSNTSNVEIVK